MNSAERVDFAELWSCSRASVAAYCRSAVRNPTDADDLLQRVALRAWRGFPTFRGDSAFLTWVMRIAEREAARVGARETARMLRETSLDGVEESIGRQPPPSAAADRRWLVEAIVEARDRGALTVIEHEVLRRRLKEPDATWESIAGTLSMTAPACAAVHCRAVPRLRVFLFVHRIDLLGGPAAVQRAFQLAIRARAQPLSGSERAAFQAVVLDGRSGYRRRGWQTDLRRACGLVIKYLPPPEDGP